MQHGNCEKRKIVILELGNILDRKKHHSAVIVYSPQRGERSFIVSQNNERFQMNYFGNII